jgi:hypothetical protein
MQYKWASTKTNPAAQFLPQTFSKDEEALLYRCLGSAATTTERRGAAAGPLEIKGDKKKYISLEQEAVLKALKRDSNDVLVAVRAAIERNKDRKPISARTWKKEYDLSKFDDWWKKTAKLSLEKRVAAVDALNAKYASRTSYAKPVKSGTIGFFGRDSQNPWGRACGWNVLNAHQFSKVLPLIRRIDEAFRLAVPQRYDAQRRFCNRLDPRFVIEGTCFTTITVNKNFRTYAHRDSGDLSQGLSNLAVFSNGREFGGGHLVLPEFNLEFTLKPRDLLFIANHEYIHENTAIEALDPESERISIVCYAREDLAFCGTYEFEELRRRFTLECGKPFARMWESPRWYNYLMRELGYPTASLVEKARNHKFLNREMLTLSAKFGGLPWNYSNTWETLDILRAPSFKQRQALRALISAIHFKTPRQDKWSDEDGPVGADALYLNSDRWAIAYCESESGAVKLPNNRFNVHAVGHLPFVPSSITRLPKDLCEWLEACWEAKEEVRLIRWATGVPEAPYRMGLTTIGEGAGAAELKKLTKGTTPGGFYESVSGMALRSTWRLGPKTAFYYDLGWSHRPVRLGVLCTDGYPVCEGIQLRDDHEIDYLEQEVTHWMKRAKNIGSDDFKTRYERIGTYALSSTIEMRLAGSPWNVEATPAELIIIKKQRWKPTLHKSYLKKAEASKLKWSSPFQALPALGSNVGSDATLIIWRLKDNAGVGQAVVTNGENYWMFQAIGSSKPITKRARGDKALQITEPTIVGHLQRSEIVLKTDKSKLVENLRKRAEFVTSPFSEMAKSKLEGYRSDYRNTRANVLAIAGEPATGKSFVLRQLIEKASDWKPSRFGKVLDYSYSKSLNLYVLGTYEKNDKHPGTDKLSTNVFDDAQAFIRSLAGKPVNVVFEGDRLFKRKFLEFALGQETNLAILRFRVSEALKTQRHALRKDNQKDSFIKGRQTAIERVCQSPTLWDYVEEVRHESKEDNLRITKMMHWFLSDRLTSAT